MQTGTPFTQPWPLDAWPDVPTSGVAGTEDGDLHRHTRHGLHEVQRTG